MKYYTSSLDINATLFFWLIPKIEVYWVLAWWKEVWLIGLWSHPEKSKLLFDDFFMRNNLYVKYMDEWTTGDTIAVYWKTLESVQNWYKDDWKKLWYPKCCLLTDTFTLKNFLFNGQIIYKVYEHTKDTSLLPYYTNFLFTLATRQYKFPINTQVLSHGGMFISHTPHAFDCPASIEIWKKTEQLLEKIDAPSLKIIQEKTQKNYLFFGPTNWLAFDYDLVWKHSIVIYEWILTDTSLENIFSYATHLDFDTYTLRILKDNNERAIYIVWKDFLYLRFKPESTI
jgi:hypothetical protein